MRKEVISLGRRILATILQFRTAERGEVYVEYVVLGALAVLVILSAVQYFFGALSGLFQRLGDAVSGL